MDSKRMQSDEGDDHPSAATTKRKEDRDFKKILNEIDIRFRKQDP